MNSGVKINSDSRSLSLARQSATKIRCRSAWVFGALVVLSAAMFGQQPLPGVEYPEHVFRSVIPVAVGEIPRDIHAAGFHAYPLRVVYQTSEWQGVEYTGYRSFESPPSQVRRDLMSPPEVFVWVDGVEHRLDPTQQAAQTIENELVTRQSWVLDVSPGIVARLWMTTYPEDWELALLVSNSDASTPLKDHQVRLHIGESNPSEGLMPPNYGKALRVGSRPPEDFVRPLWHRKGVGLIGGPSQHLVDSVFDGSWLDADEHIGFYHPLGVRYGGMTGGDGINLFPELHTNLSARVFTDQIRYHDRQRLEMEFSRVPVVGNSAVFDYKFLRGETGTFQYEDPDAYFEPKGPDDIRVYDCIDNQHAIRGMRYDIQLAWKTGDPLSCYWLEQWGSWAHLTFDHRVTIESGPVDFGRAEAWGLKAMAGLAAMGQAQGHPAGSNPLVEALLGSALPSGLFQGITWGKIATDPPYNGANYCGRSQEQLFLASALTEWGKVTGDTGSLLAARNCIHGLLDVCWWSEESAGFVDRYPIGTLESGPIWTERMMDYPSLGAGIFHDSYDTGNLPALLYYAGDPQGAAMALGRVAGTTDITDALTALGWSSVSPGTRGTQRLGRAPYSNYGLSYGLLWLLQ